MNLSPSLTRYYVTRIYAGQRDSLVVDTNMTLEQVRKSYSKNVDRIIVTTMNNQASK